MSASDGRAPALVWTTAGNGASSIRGPYESCGAALAASGISLSCPHTWAPFATVGASEVCAPWQECCPPAGDCASRDAHAIPHAVSAAGAQATASTSRHAPMRRLISMSICERRDHYTFAVRSRSALPITDTELKLMAAAAIIGESRIPNTG